MPRQEHIARVLDEFQYLTGIKHFFHNRAPISHFTRLAWFTMTSIHLADLLLVSSLSKSSDPAAVGGRHLIKAMRWLAVVPILNVFYDEIISSLLNTKKPKDRQETCPFMLHSAVHFERRVLLHPSTENEVLFLGACLVPCWGGLHFADSQRLPLKRFVFQSLGKFKSSWSTFWLTTPGISFSWIV